MPRYGANRSDIGLAMGNLGASLLGGFGRRQGQMDGYRQLVNMTQAEQNQLENDELRRVASLDPYQQTFNDMGLIGADAENYRQAMTTGQIPEGVDPEKLRQGLALFNVYQRGGKVTDVEKASGDAFRNYLSRQVNPNNVADIGAQIGALDGKPMEGLRAQLTTGIARGEEQPNTMRALMASQGKGLYDNMPGGVFNIDTGEQNINDLGRSVIGKNQAQAYQAQTGATENLAQANRASPSGVNVPNVKPLPVPALKMIKEELDAIGTVSGTSSDIESIINQIDKKELDLSLLGNLENKARNFIGNSSLQSRNYDAFMATMEKMRNDTLLLAKGVQTEGDAQRAWNQLMSKPNDSENVKQQLERIKAINERSENLRRMNIDNIRANYGLPPMDVSGYENQKSAIQDKPPASTDQVQVDITQESWDAMPPEQKQQLKSDIEREQQNDPFRGFTPEQKAQFLKEHPDWKP